MGKKQNKQHASHSLADQTLEVYRTQAISQADRRQKKTNVAQPSDENVEIARDWVNFNQK